MNGLYHTKYTDACFKRLSIFFFKKGGLFYIILWVNVNKLVRVMLDGRLILITRSMYTKMERGESWWIEKLKKRKKREPSKELPIKQWLVSLGHPI